MIPYTIDELLNEYFELTDGTISIDNGLVSVHGSKSIIKLVKNIDKLPVRFDTVEGRFLCYGKGLYTLDGCPRIVGGEFNYSSNNLTDPSGGPVECGTYFGSGNNLTTLVGSPKIVNNSHYAISSNYLPNLIGATESTLQNFTCTRILTLTSLEGLPKVTRLLQISWNKNLPLLRLLSVPDTCKITFLNHVHPVSIMKKYRGQEPLKKAIWECQKELIENGFDGNAKW
jgi:hypothetical protein